MFIRRFNSVNLVLKRTKFTLPDLPYDFNALEPVISAEIMQIHHQKHHAAYVSNLNLALEKFEEARSKDDLNTQVALQSQIKFNGGGNINHSIFWKNLCPPKDAKGEPNGPLADAIKKSFGSFDAFKTLFTSQTAAVQGSGWGWLVKKNKAEVVPFYSFIFLYVGIQSDNWTSSIRHYLQSRSSSSHHRPCPSFGN